MRADTFGPLFLVADDAPVLARILSNLVADGGGRVLGPATDGAQALQLYRDHLPAGAVLDILMPQLSGLDVLRAIRADGRHCLVVVVTASDDPALREAAFDAGADHFLVKGRDLHRLEEIVARARDAPRPG